MEKSIVQANFQLLDNYISEFSLRTFRRIRQNEEFDAGINIAFRIVNINEESMTGQIELKYDIVVNIEKKEVAKINITSNAIFNGSKEITKERFEEMLKINGATMLSHINRAYINSATSLSGMPTIIIPLINFNDFFKNAISKKEENNKDK